MVRCLLVLTALLIASPAAADIVNVQGALAKQPEPGWSGTIGGSLDWRTGNTRLIQVGGNSTVLYRDGRFLGLVLLRGEIGEAEDVRFAEKAFAHLRGRVSIAGPWMWEAFAQDEYDAFRRLEARALAGTGPAVRLVNTAQLGAVLGVAYLLEYQRLDDAVAIDAGDTFLEHRLSSYLTGTYKLDDRLATTATAYVQPRIDKPSDLHLLGELALTTQVTGRVALVSAFVIAYDESPPASIDRLDTTLKTTVTVSF
jgi:hypothetical protein